MEGFEHHRALPKVEVEPFEVLFDLKKCTIPLKVYGCLKCPSTLIKKMEFKIE